MGRKALTYWALLVGGYLILSHATGFGQSVKALGDTGTAATKVLQGR